MSNFASGTQTVTISTRHQLSAPSFQGIYTLVVDTFAMASGDTLIISIDMRAASGTSERTVYSITYNDAQTLEPIKITIPVCAPFSSSFYIQQTAGTARSYPWTLISN